MTGRAFDPAFIPHRRPWWFNLKATLSTWPIPFVGILHHKAHMKYDFMCIRLSLHNKDHSLTRLSLGYDLFVKDVAAIDWSPTFSAIALGIIFPFLLLVPTRLRPGVSPRRSVTLQRNWGNAASVNVRVMSEFTAGTSCIFLMLLRRARVTIESTMRVASSLNLPELCCACSGTDPAMSGRVVLAVTNDRATYFYPSL